MKSDARGPDDFSRSTLLRSADGEISALLTRGGLIGVMCRALGTRRPHRLWILRILSYGPALLAGPNTVANPWPPAWLRIPVHVHRNEPGW